MVCAGYNILGHFDFAHASVIRDDWCSVIIKHSVFCSSLICRFAMPFALTLLYSQFFFGVISGLCETNQLHTKHKCMESHMFWNIINFDEEFLCYSTEYKSWWYYKQNAAYAGSFGQLLRIVLDAPLLHFMLFSANVVHDVSCFFFWVSDKHSLRSLFLSFVF